MVKRLPTMWETRVSSLGWEDCLEKEMTNHSSILAWKIPWTEEPGRLQSMGSQRVGHEVAQTVKHLPTMQETQVQSLGREELLEQEMATHPSILAWRIPMGRGAWRATVQGLQSQTQLSTRRESQLYMKISLTPWSCSAETKTHILWRKVTTC